MKNSRLTVGSRSSRLALWQTDFIIGELRRRYPELAIEKKTADDQGG